jgi:hypothetical protein
MAGKEKKLEDIEPHSVEISEDSIGEQGNQPETSGGYLVCVAHKYLATLLVLKGELQMSSMAVSSGINPALEALLAGHARRA